MGHSQNLKRLKASSYKKVESNKQSICTVILKHFRHIHVLSRIIYVYKCSSLWCRLYVFY